VFLRFRCILLVLALCTFFCSCVLAVQRPQVRLDITGGVTGSITIELYTDKAPITCANFVKYVQSGFYNNLIFHRVIKNFMIQAGAYDQSLVYHSPTYPDIINESSNRLSNVRGTIAMARSYQPDSANSQFFVNDVNNTFLDYGPVAYDDSGNAYAKIGYCVFGRVVAGINIVDSVSGVLTGKQGDMNDVPLTPIKIQDVVVLSPICIEKLSGDLNGDCKVDLSDFAIMADDWLESNSLLACAFSLTGDMNNDCVVDFGDVTIVSQNWLDSVSGPPCSTALAGDANNDCRVDFKDFTLLAKHWFECSAFSQSAC
jgi:cyclophilin family peptidyl-prolyl cis-trans isomerase